MRKVSLGIKIVFIALIPLLAFFILALINLNTALDKSNLAGVIQKKVQLFELSSKVIHQTQRERAISIMFINGTAASSDLTTQRNQTNEMITPFKAELKASYVDQTERENGLSAIESLMKLRESVDSKLLSAPETAKKYSEIISIYLQSEIRMAKASKLEEIPSMLLTQTIFEVAKESGGRLRAHILAILGADKPSNFS